MPLWRGWLRSLGDWLYGWWMILTTTDNSAEGRDNRKERR